MKDDLVFRLRKRAQIRRQIPSRKSVQNNEPDRIADLLEEAADYITQLQTPLSYTKFQVEEAAKMVVNEIQKRKK